jgi:hypothetical protein
MLFQQVEDWFALNNSSTGRVLVTLRRVPITSPEMQHVVMVRRLLSRVATLDLLLTAITGGIKIRDALDKRSS